MLFKARFQFISCSNMHPRTSELKQGDTLRGHVYDCRTGERRGMPSREEKNRPLYLMPWGESLIGVDPGTRKRIDWWCAMAWEHDSWMIRCLKTSVDAESCIGSLGRHPLAPPVDAERIERFNDALAVRLHASPFSRLPLETVASLDQCSRRHYCRIKLETDNMLDHAKKLSCATCSKMIPREGMQCCKDCKFHVPVCSQICFCSYWTMRHKADCKRHKLVKSYKQPRGSSGSGAFGARIA